VERSLSFWLHYQVHPLIHPIRQHDLQNLVIPACIGAFALGTALAWTSPALPYIADCTKPEGECDFEFDATVGSWIGSLLTLGCLATSFVTGFLMGKIGRKWTIVLMSVPFILGWVLILLPMLLSVTGDGAKWLFYTGRFLTGV
jgi:MFS family permease